MSTFDEHRQDFRPGNDGDLTIVDLNREREVVNAEHGSYPDSSLYDGWTFRGRRWRPSFAARG